MNNIWGTAITPADRWSPDLDLGGAALDLEVLYEAGREIANSIAWPQWSAESEYTRARAPTLLIP